MMEAFRTLVQAEVVAVVRDFFQPLVAQVQQAHQGKDMTGVLVPAVQSVNTEVAVVEAQEKRAGPQQLVVMGATDCNPA
jgi:hypothetical protein